jgi:hypothetical protein
MVVRKNGFKVSNTAYFYSCNGDSNKADFTGSLQFKISLLPYKGDDSWVENTLYEIKECLVKNELPNPTKDCDYCGYFAAATKHIQKYANEHNHIEIMPLSEEKSFDL